MTRLLIADDEEAILFAMKEYFESLGYEVDCAQRKEEALSLLDAGSYALVIADLRMGADRPRDGLDLAAAVKQRSPVTRTVLLTACGSPEAFEQARTLGVDAILHKQERLGDVADIVRWLTGRPS